MTDTQSNRYMIQALDIARQAAGAGEIPVGAVLVNHETGAIVAQSGNRTETDHDATGHAEIKVLQEGGRIFKTPRLNNCDLYVTLEPCPMCAAAISMARIRRLYFGAYDPKTGGVEHGPRVLDSASCHHKPDVYGGIHETEAAALLKDFFKDKR
jgi:tRNA(Arg) A34 adenosine deaminase TadA